MNRELAAVFAFFGLAGCGSRAALLPDASRDRGSDTDNEVAVDAPDARARPSDGALESPPLLGRHAYDVVATLTAKAMAGELFTSLPATNAFTLVLDADGMRILAGTGSAQTLRGTAGPGNTFSFKAEPPLGLSIGLGGFAMCFGFLDVNYRSLTFAVDGASLTGKAEGVADYLRGDLVTSIAFTATLAGGLDTTPPRVLIDGPDAIDPMRPPAFRTTEPGTATSKARLVAASGGFIDLAPKVTDDGDRAVIGFERPDVVLRYGESYRVDATGVTDFAGLAGAASALSFVTPAAPPLVDEDGFEAVGTATLGGAAVVRDGPLPPLAGGVSLYVEASSGPWPARYQPGPALTVRLPVRAGDTKLRFSYRVVAANPTLRMFSGEAFAGAVGGGTSYGTTFTDGGHVTTIGPIENGTAYLGDLQTMELALPAGATTEVVFELLTSSFTCGPPYPLAGVLVDDLRVE